MRRTSIKRKIQNAMFLANVLTLVITLGAIWMITTNIYGPLSSYFTNSVASEYLKKYGLTANDLSTFQNNQRFMSEYSLDQVIENLNSRIQQKQGLSNDMKEAFNFEEEMSITATTDDDYKRIMVLAKEVYDESVAIAFGISPVYITVDLLGRNFQASDHSEEAAAFMDQIMTGSSTIQIIDENGANIGNIVFKLNPNMVIASVALFLTLLIILSLAAMLIVKIVSKVLSTGIVKPIAVINNQLSLMADNEVENLSNFKLEMRKPPQEIKQIIDSSNIIIDKFKTFSVQLENQNEELHMQNDELMHNRLIIENQQKQLIQSEKMASVGQIAAAVVHEINTPIGAIKSNAQMMDMVIDKLTHEMTDEKAQKKLATLKQTNGMVVDASDRVIQIVKSIKSFSRIDQSAFKDADLHEAIESVLILTSNLWKSRIQIVKNYGDLPSVNCYISLINQVIMNLVVNAIDAIEGVGEIRITTGIKDQSATISVADTGSGIPPENLMRVFEQGFTTKPVGKGSGLGLALSKDIMDKHHGQITVESEVGKGSIFTITIPIKAPDTQF